MNTTIWNPSTLLEDASGTHQVSLLTKQLAERIIYITSPIDDTVATSVISQLLYLSRESNEDITILISSPGGSVVDGMAIYDAIQALEGKVTINMIGYGMVASMAAVLLASGHEGHRYLMPSAKLLIHEPLMNGGVGGSCTSIAETAEKILETKKMLCEVLAKHCHKSIKTIEKALKGGVDVILSPLEAIEFGAIDGIRTPFDN